MFDEGGYYFDINLQMTGLVGTTDEDTAYLRPLSKLSITALDEKEDEDTFKMSESFMAVAAKHPLLRLEIENLVEYYSNRRNEEKSDSERNQERMVVSYKGKKLEGEKQSFMVASEDF